MLLKMHQGTKIKITNYNKFLLPYPSVNYYTEENLYLTLSLEFTITWTCFFY